MAHELRKLTWAVLLGRWVEFARSAVALPDDETGRALRAAVPDLIALQAVRCALDESDQLEASERALGIDRARILIERHSGHLSQLFGEPMDPRIGSFITEASEALERATRTS